MLKVSSLFVLLCGLVGSSTAQLPVSESSKGLVGGGLFSSLQVTDFQDSIKNFFAKSTSPLEFDVQLTSEESKIMVQVKDLQILQVSLKSSPDSKSAELNMPLEFSMLLKLPALKPFIFHMGADMQVQLHLEKNADGRYRLTFGHCRLIPESVWIQSENLDTPTQKFIGENIEKNTKTLIIDYLETKMCHIINSWLYHLNPPLANELLNMMLQPGTYQLTI